jgi:hypothetical protein
MEACVAVQEETSARQHILALAIEAEDDPRYWIQVEARATAKLRNLDRFLRELWLECCGHMSAFYVGRAEIDMRTTLGKAIGAKGKRFIHEYDFGTTTILRGRVQGERLGSLGGAQVRVLARNDPPTWECARCDEPATVVCPYCSVDDLVVYCPAHASKDRHAKERVYLPVVNSPRMGVCGYVGLTAKQSRRREVRSPRS